MARKRISKRSRDLAQSAMFFVATFCVIASLILYLWVYTQIDETLLVIEIQNITVNELSNELKELKSDIESLSRPDVIAKRAGTELSMDFTQPETLLIAVNQKLIKKL